MILKQRNKDVKTNSWHHAYVYVEFQSLNFQATKYQIFVKKNNGVAAAAIEFWNLKP